LKCKHTYFTGPIDAYYAHLGYKKLEYRSLDFERKVMMNVGRNKTFQPAFVVNHPSTDDNYTRIVEYKHLLNQTSDHTIMFIERSKDGGEPYYPVPNLENKALFKRYQELAANETGVTFVGRLANYKYFNMDEAILNALELFDKDNNIVHSENSKEKPSFTTCVP
jgi:UDP-galactopyranose mutase